MEVVITRWTSRKCPSDIPVVSPVWRSSSLVGQRLTTRRLLSKRCSVGSDGSGVERSQELVSGVTSNYRAIDASPLRTVGRTVGEVSGRHWLPVKQTKHSRSVRALPLATTTTTAQPSIQSMGRLCRHMLSYAFPAAQLWQHSLPVGIRQGSLSTDSKPNLIPDSIQSILCVWISLSLLFRVYFWLIRRF